MATKTAKGAASKPVQRRERYVLIGSKVEGVPSGLLVRSRFEDLPPAVREAPRKQAFISYMQSATDDLLQAGLKLDRGTRMGTLLTLEPPRPESVPSLSGIFERVIGAAAGYRWLPLEELLTAILTKDAPARFIGGAVDEVGGSVALVRGNLNALVAPLSFFKPSGDGTIPDFSTLSFTDYGLTVVFGDYEASADGILYEFDPAYRQKLNKARLQTEQSFGASLRRLRLQRGLNRGDFAPVASKTIARIERGEVEKPRSETLETIAQRLGVPADQIGSY